MCRCVCVYECGVEAVITTTKQYTYIVCKCIARERERVMQSYEVYFLVSFLKQVYSNYGYTRRVCMYVCMGSESFNTLFQVFLQCTHMCVYAL